MKTEAALVHEFEAMTLDLLDLVDDVDDYELVDQLIFMSECFLADLRASFDARQVYH
jgi:hypothetical protein